MDMKNNGSAYRRIKGFTLVELVVVMAIIAVLAGIMSLAVQGFIRNARRESANDNARLLFTGFQNIVTQCEIKQDSSVLSPDRSNLRADNSKHEFKSMTVSFKMYDGNVRAYQIDSTGITAADTMSSPAVIFGTGYSGDNVKYSDAAAGSNMSTLPNEIVGIVDNTFEGEVKVYIDYENYEVKSVVYKPMTEANRNTTINNFNDGGLVVYSTGGSTGYLTYFDGDSQNTAYDNHPLYGVYPFQKDLV